MALRSTEENGVTYVRRNEQWSEATPRDLLALGASPMEAFGLGVAGAVQGLGQTLYNAAAGPRPDAPTPPGEAMAANVAQFQPGMVNAGRQRRTWSVSIRWRWPGV